MWTTTIMWKEITWSTQKSTCRRLKEKGRSDLLNLFNYFYSNNKINENLNVTFSGSFHKTENDHNKMSVRMNDRNEKPVLTEQFKVKGEKDESKKNLRDSDLLGI